MYEVGDVLPVERLDAGSYLLAGPAMSGKYGLVLDVLVEGIDGGEGALFVTTNEGADGVFDDIESRAGEIPHGLRVVDCVSEQQGPDGEFPADRVEYVSSPADLTGVGIGVSEQLRRFVEADTDRVRVGFHSLSTLLMYVELQTVFQFVHVLSGRVDGLDGLGVFAIDPTTHEESTVNTLKQLFDGVIEVRDQDGVGQIRFVGIPDTPEGWIDRP